MTNEKDCATIAAMDRWGGGFVQALAQAAGGPRSVPFKDVA